MGLFDPPDAPGLPEPILAYRDARIAWLAVWGDPPDRHPEVWARFGRASVALESELRRRGGAWKFGDHTFRLGRKFGVEIETAVASQDGGGEPEPDPAGHQDG